MALSTSHSKGRFPRRVLSLAGLALGAWLVGAFYTLRLNPEIAYDRHSHLVKKAWAERLDRDFPNKIVVYGGSSCRTSIMGERMLRQQELPVLNLGLAAGMGSKLQTRYAFQYLRPGDVLVVAVEPGLLMQPLEIPTHGVQFAFATANTALLRNGRHVNWPSALLNLRPGAYYLFTLFGKILLHQPPYRYLQSDLHPDGWQEIAGPRSFPDPKSGASLTISEEQRGWLAHIRDACGQRGVRVCYSLPWSYCSSNELEAFRRQNAEFLSQVSALLPVLKDPMLGAYPIREHFADTALHLNPAGAAARSDQLARAIKAWDLWSARELALR